MKLQYTFFLVIGLLLHLSLAGEAHAQRLYVSIAASMSDSFKRIISQFNTLYPDTQVYINFGPSGGLARQIDQGAPADLYVSANPAWVDYLIKQGKIKKSNVATLAHNSLVLIGRKSKTFKNLDELAGLARIGIGNPKNVPAGQYARQAMEKVGIYKMLLGEGKLILAKDVRQALVYAERGETDASFVYATDMQLAKQARVLYRVPEEMHDPIIYPLALTNDGSMRPAARLLYEYALSNSAAATLAEFGFTEP